MVGRPGDTNIVCSDLIFVDDVEQKSNFGIHTAAAIFSLTEGEISKPYGDRTAPPLGYGLSLKAKLSEAKSTKKTGNIPTINDDCEKPDSMITGTKFFLSMQQIYFINRYKYKVQNYAWRTQDIIYENPIVTKTMKTMLSRLTFTLFQARCIL